MQFSYGIIHLVRAQHFPKTNISNPLVRSGKMHSKVKSWYLGSMTSRLNLV